MITPNNADAINGFIYNLATSMLLLTERNEYIYSNILPEDKISFCFNLFQNIRKQAWINA